MKLLNTISFCTTFLLISVTALAQHKGFVNPSAAYCEKLGYTYEIRTDAKGNSYGVCILPNDSAVNAWDFYKGKVASEYSYCEKMGFSTECEIVEENGCISETAVCVQKLEDNSVVKIPLGEFMKQNGDTLILTRPQKKSTNLIFENAPLNENFRYAETTPDSFDWRNHNGHSYIGGVRNQGSCGSCYAFGANAAAEGTYNFANGLYDSNCIDLSESFIIWCLGSIAPYSNHFSGCEGADYDYVELQALCDSGACFENDFPYLENDPEECTHWDDERVKMDNWYRIGCSDTTAIKTAIMSYGVVDAAVFVAGSFESYSGGIYTDANTTCYSTPCYYTPTNHAISLVGWGHDETHGLYWILRNSWGTDWGEDGYMRIKWNAARVACEVCYMVCTPETSPQGFNASACSQSQIDLSWQPNVENDPVLLAWSPDGNFGQPVDGTVYNTGDAIPGGGTVLYYGYTTSFNHTALSPSTTYYYSAWSNVSGVYSKGVFGSAITFCEPTSSFPFSEEFTTGELPACWSVIDHRGNGQVWQFTNPGGRSIATTTNANGFAILDSDNYGEGSSQNCDLVSPPLNFSNHTNIALQFEHYYFHYTGSAVSLLYSTDNGNSWTELGSWSTSTANTELYFRDLTSELEGQANVYIKWNFTGAWGWYWAVDDLLITADQVIPITETITNITLGEGENNCFGALETITVAGDGYPVVLQNGSTTSLIAGQSIYLRHGFHAQNGSYMDAHITETGSFCDDLIESTVVEYNAPVAYKSETVEPEKSIQGSMMAEPSVKVYPNPNNGEFTVELHDFEGESRVMLFNSTGQLIHNGLTTDREMQLIIPHAKSGMYFIKTVNKDNQFMQKIVVK